MIELLYSIFGRIEIDQILYIMFTSWSLIQQKVQCYITSRLQISPIEIGQSFQVSRSVVNPMWRVARIYIDVEMFYATAHSSYRQASPQLVTNKL